MILELKHLTCTTYHTKIIIHLLAAVEPVAVDTHIPELHTLILFRTSYVRPPNRVTVPYGVSMA